MATKTMTIYDNIYMRMRRSTETETLKHEQSLKMAKVMSVKEVGGAQGSQST